MNSNCGSNTKTESKPNNAPNAICRPICWIARIDEIKLSDKPARPKMTADVVMDGALSSIANSILSWTLCVSLNSI